MQDSSFNQNYRVILQALKLLRCAEFAPYVVFIAAPTNLPQRGDKFFVSILIKTYTVDVSQ